jgi:hypothetical protein
MRSTRIWRAALAALPAPSGRTALVWDHRPRDKALFTVAKATNRTSLFAGILERMGLEPTTFCMAS